MKPLFNRTRIASGITALAVAFSAGVAVPATARAASTWAPSDADFANCPALPGGAIKLLWHCISITMVGGKIKLGKVDKTISDPIQINIGFGPLNGKIVSIMGGGPGGPGPKMEIPTGIDFPKTVEIEVGLAGNIGFDLLQPVTIPLKIRVGHWLLGWDCYIGTENTPINLRPKLSNTRLQNTSDRWVLRSDMSDSTFSVPGASGCGPFGVFNGMINNAVSLPSPSGNNSVTMDTAVQLHNYQLGNVTRKEAKKFM